MFFLIINQSFLTTNLKFLSSRSAIKRIKYRIRSRLTNDMLSTPIYVSIIGPSIGQRNIQLLFKELHKYGLLQELLSLLTAAGVLKTVMRFELSFSGV